MRHWIFLRGLIRESRHWGSFPDKFRAAVPDSEVVMLDLPGNGALNQMQSPLTIAAMMEHCRAELTRRGIHPPHRVLAMSLGAMVTVAWADRYPTELESGVLISTSMKTFSPFYQRFRPKNYPALLRLAMFGGESAVWEKTIIRLTSNTEQGSAERVNEWSALRRENPVSRSNALRQLWAASQYHAPKKAPAVRWLVLAGAGDKLVAPSCSRRLALQWRADYAEHPTAGHDIPLDDGTWVARQVDDWLRLPKKRRS